jgi:hypothetical protein
METCWNLLFVVHIEFKGKAFGFISGQKMTRREYAYYEV